MVNLIAADAVSSELQLGSIPDLCRSIQDHQASNCKFHRIFYRTSPTASAFDQFMMTLHPSFTLLQCAKLYQVQCLGLSYMTGQPT
mmetsp:Transcript_17900/g.29081  ORF Transcript_17900/g.29081 Transcript_17900/m.29081 type:complete len:86 (-) Transcript_17900:695-952(-)